MEIPRIIHRLWLGGPEPEWQEPFLDTWSHHHPEEGGWEVWQWGKATVEDLLFPLENQAVWDAAEVICPQHYHQLRSDVVRYEILKRFGGVWVDADFECLRPIDPLLKRRNGFAVWELKPVFLNNAILAGYQGHAMFDDLIDGLEQNVEANMGSKPNVLSGPQYMTSVWRGRKHGRSIDALDTELFYPFLWDEVERYAPGTLDPTTEWPQAYAVHWWANKRRERGLVHVG